MFKLYSIIALDNFNQVLRVSLLGGGPRDEFKTIAGDAQECLKMMPETDIHIELVIAESCIVPWKFILKNGCFKYAVVNVDYKRLPTDLVLSLPEPLFQLTEVW